MSVVACNAINGTDVSYLSPSEDCDGRSPGCHEQSTTPELPGPQGSSGSSPASPDTHGNPGVVDPGDEGEDPGDDDGVRKDAGADATTDAAPPVEAGACLGSNKTCGSLLDAGGATARCCSGFVCKNILFASVCVACVNSGAKCGEESSCCPGLTCRTSGSGKRACAP